MIDAAAKRMVVSRIDPNREIELHDVRAQNAPAIKIAGRCPAGDRHR